MSELTWGRLRPVDVPAWAELTNLLATVDQTEEFYDADDLAEELDEPGFDPALDSWAVWDGDQLVAFGQLRVSSEPDASGQVRCQLDGGVHPDHRGRGIGRELMGRLEARGRELAHHRHPGLAAHWRVGSGRAGSSAERMLSHRGYEIVRWFHEMRRPIPGNAVEVPEVPGVRLVSPSSTADDALRLAHNAAFADHWGTTPSSSERWAHQWAARSNRPDLSTVALDDAGRPLSYVLVGQWTPRDAYVNLVGTVPEARGRGLAAACLAATIGKVTESGDYDRIELTVDSDSLTGATRLYERAGFEAVFTTATMRREVT